MIILLKKGTIPHYIINKYISRFIFSNPSHYNSGKTIKYFKLRIIQIIFNST